MTINNVTIGDAFKTGKHTISKVVDFHKVTSLTTGEEIGYKCIAQATGAANNLHEVPFATVVRNKVNQLKN
jgi:hypothetical protein